MEQELKSLIALPKQAVDPKAPSLHLTFNACSELSLTLPYHIEFTISRDRDDYCTQPIAFKWSPNSDGFTEEGFVLLRHNNNSLERVPIDYPETAKSNDKEICVTIGFDHHVWTLAPGDSIKLLAPLPETHHKALEPNQQYTLLWPGLLISKWDFGTMQNRTGHVLEDTEESPALILPGSPHTCISFVAKEETEAWPDRPEIEARFGFTEANLQEETWRKSRSQPRAPKLSVALECPTSLSLGTVFEVSIKVTYDAMPDARPIIFHAHVFDTEDNLQLHRLEGDNWNVCEDFGDEGGFLLVDDPDVPINVAQDTEKFVSLRPGESWSTSRRLQGEKWTYLPDDSKGGNRFRVEFDGATVDWWDWGSREEHKDTVVKLPCWIKGPVVDPKDNGGREKMNVSASDVVEFSVGKE
ncbi:hypothetical protein EJ04DRAFT_556160 [Polyplosphaeria fusca]|uniref:Uncharacterized protein n=1 Tax=Polyplosphaeria fusca TaxID=682080 RepID=A0A9P4QPH2_9PLEO|nr:hypothetical protein EJ04DRAFT_556160 [Polyplosphaeria fusca]